jgi:hypothetical protein
MLTLFDGTLGINVNVQMDALHVEHYTTLVS